MLNSFGVICFGLVGLELASIMGDEIENPRKTLPGAVAWGGVLSGFLYVGATLTLLVAVDKNSISVLQGIVQAMSHMAGQVGVGLDCGAVCVSVERVDCRALARRGWEDRRGFRSWRAWIRICPRGWERFIRSTPRPMRR